MVAPDNQLIDTIGSFLLRHQDDLPKTKAYNIRLMYGDPIKVHGKDTFESIGEAKYYAAIYLKDTLPLILKQKPSNALERKTIKYLKNMFKDNIYIAEDIILLRDSMLDNREIEIVEIEVQ